MAANKQLHLVACHGVQWGELLSFPIPSSVEEGEYAHWTVLTSLLPSLCQAGMGVTAICFAFAHVLKARRVGSHFV